MIFRKFFLKNLPDAKNWLLLQPQEFVDSMISQFKDSMIEIIRNL